MRPRTPTLIWIPFVFSVGAVSWSLLIASLVLLGVLVIGPAVRDVKAAESQRNDIRATRDLLEQKIALQKQFMTAANADPLLMQRLASRQLHLERTDQEVLLLDPNIQKRDRSISSLLASSLQTVTPQAVEPMPWWLEKSMLAPVRPILLMLGLTGLVFSFLLGVKYEK